MSKNMHKEFKNLKEEDLELVAKEVFDIIRNYFNKIEKENLQKIKDKSSQMENRREPLLMGGADREASGVGLDREAFVIFLNGDLGAGKTTLAKNLGKVLGIQEIIISPTFILRKDYSGQTFNLIHIDGYRFETPEESKVLELDAVFIPTLKTKQIILIEWAEKFTDFYNLKADLEIDIKPSSEFSRDFFLKF